MANLADIVGALDRLAERLVPTSQSGTPGETAKPESGEPGRTAADKQSDMLGASIANHIQQIPYLRLMSRQLSVIAEASKRRGPQSIPAQAAASRAQQKSAIDDFIGRQDSRATPGYSFAPPIMPPAMPAMPGMAPGVPFAAPLPIAPIPPMPSPTPGYSATIPPPPPHGSSATPTRPYGWPAGTSSWATPPGHSTTVTPPPIQPPPPPVTPTITPRPRHLSEKDHLADFVANLAERGLSNVPVVGNVARYARGAHDIYKGAMGFIEGVADAKAAGLPVAPIVSAAARTLAAALASPLTPIALFAGGVFVAGGALLAFGKYISESNRRLAGYSGQMAAAFAIGDVRGIMRDIGSAHRRAPTEARFQDSWGNMMDALVPIIDRVANAMEDLASDIANTITPILEFTNWIQNTNDKFRKDNPILAKAWDIANAPWNMLMNPFGAAADAIGMIRNGIGGKNTDGGLKQSQFGHVGYVGFDIVKSVDALADSMEKLRETIDQQGDSNAPVSMAMIGAGMATHQHAAEMHGGGIPAADPHGDMAPYRRAWDSFSGATRERR